MSGFGSVNLSPTQRKAAMAAALRRPPPPPSDLRLRVTPAHAVKNYTGLNLPEEGAEEYGNARVAFAPVHPRKEQPPTEQGGSRRKGRKSTRRGRKTTRGSRKSTRRSRKSTRGNRRS